MIDIKLIREEIKLVRDNIKRKGQDSKLKLVDELKKKDDEWRKRKYEADDLRSKRNKKIIHKIFNIIGHNYNLSWSIFSWIFS